MKGKTTYTETAELMIDVLDAECPHDITIGSPEEELLELSEALNDWELVLELDIRSGDRENIHSDRCRIMETKLRIRELKEKIRVEQCGRLCKMEDEAA